MGLKVLVEAIQVDEAEFDEAQAALASGLGYDRLTKSGRPQVADQPLPTKADFIQAQLEIYVENIMRQQKVQSDEKAARVAAHEAVKDKFKTSH